MLIGLVLSLWPVLGAAEDKLVRVYAPPVLIDTGVLKFALPRFSLKTQVRIELVGPDAADMVFGDGGRALFEGAGQVWHMDVRSPDHPGTQRLADWLTSDVGQRTVLSYAPDGVALFSPPQEVAQVVAEVAADGDAALGQELSRVKCARCHVVDEATRWSGIGSTPSFAVLRSLQDWEDRFAAFYVLNPHPAFTIISELTPPFPEDRPPAIVPIEMTLDELEAVMAYVTAMAPADLGQPLTHQ